MVTCVHAIDHNWQIKDLKLLTKNNKQAKTQKYVMQKINWHKETLNEYHLRIIRGKMHRLICKFRREVGQISVRLQTRFMRRSNLLLLQLMTNTTFTTELHIYIKTIEANQPSYSLDHNFLVNQINLSTWVVSKSLTFISNYDYNDKHFKH